MDFFLQITPPTATAQEKQVTVVNGRPVFYDPQELKEAMIKNEQLEKARFESVLEKAKAGTT